MQQRKCKEVDLEPHVLEILQSDSDEGIYSVAVRYFNKNLRKAVSTAYTAAQGNKSPVQQLQQLYRPRRKYCME